MWTRLRRRVGVVLGVTLLLTGGGVAVASWTATGTGQGSARAATVTGLVVGAGSPVGTLYPSNATMDTGTCRGAVSDGVAGVHVPADPGAATQTCTDSTTLNLGSVQYTVAPVWGRWVGNPSRASTAVL